MQIRPSRIIGALLLGLSLTGCATQRVKSLPAATTYTRSSQPDAGTVALEVASRKFVPARGRGPVVWLVGAAHIGRAGYSTELQQLLDAQEVVLFEGVSDSRKIKTAEQPDPMVGTLAESLGLVFQLNGINYDRPNFRHCDLTVSEIRRLLEGDAPGEGEPDPQFEMLMKMMDRRSLPGMLTSLFFKWMGADPRMRETMKLVFVTVLGEYGGDVGAMASQNPEMQHLFKVLIDERNRHVAEELGKIVRQRGAPKSIAVFYGAGHLPDLEKRLTGQLHYRPVEEVWLTAITANKETAGPFGDTLCRQLLEQMKAMQHAAQPAPP